MKKTKSVKSKFSNVTFQSTNRLFLATKMIMIMNSLNNKNCSQNSTYNILSYMVNCFLIIIITMQNVCNRFIIHSEVNVMWPYLNPLRRGIELLHLLITVTLQNLSVMFMWQWENSWVGIISHYADFSFVFTLILFFHYA